jgi:DNA helicase II / ATP-dependent DNA helicase PcrA
MNFSTEFDLRYKKLNPEQKKAVDEIEGPVMVVAGPGMGKTELLGLRVANILKQTDTPPESILCLTFTDSAAQNMLDRLENLIGVDAFKVAIHTFHSFATEVINYNPEFFYNGAKYNTADPIAQTRILNDVINNLEYNNPLAIKNQTFKYREINTIKTAISSIKSEGFVSQEYQEILEENAPVLENLEVLISNYYLNQNFRSNTGKNKAIEDFEDLVVQIQELDNSLPQSKYYERGIKKISTVYLEKLLNVLSKTRDSEKISTTDITKLRDRLLDKTNDKKYKLKELKQLPKNFALADVYKKYTDHLLEEGLFDFDDMLIEVNKAFREQPELSYKYKEKYLYLLVDEFQDTNLAQSTIIDSLVDMELSEGMPNVMVVGDDDQAIYKFQGANIDNIMSFQNRYPKTTFITLHRNYRSHQKILDLAKKVISDCQIRLSNTIEINKDLLALPDKIGKKPIVFNTSTRLQQISHIANQIKSQIDNGIDPTEIAVLVKKHKQLNDVLKIFEYYKIPVRYERATNVLDQKYIQEITTLLKYTYSILEYSGKIQDEYAHQVLAYEMFAIPALTLYKISRIAYEERVNWIDALEKYSLDTKNLDFEHIADVRQYLIDLGKLAQTSNVEQVIDEILGISKENTIMEDEKDDGAGIENFQNKKNLDNSKKNKFGLRDVIKQKPEYLIFLSGLKVFVDSLRKYKSSESIFVKDVIEYLTLIEENDLKINDNSPYNQSEKAVQLMTVYKSKGLEFEVVYVLDCLNDTWNSNRNSQKLSLAKNTPFSPETDTQDDFLRIFFVALTRAKSELYLYYFKKDESSKATKQLEFVVGAQDFVDKIEIETESTEELKAELEGWMYGDFTRRVLSLNEEEWLRPFFETYKLSATNLSNFLDVTNGGPSRFLERNILRFPESKNPAASYGTAIHEALSRGYIEYTKNNVTPDYEKIENYFLEKLSTERLTQKDYNKMKGKGLENLPIFYQKVFKNYDLGMKVEVNFKTQGVRVRGVPLTGAIDQMIFDHQRKTIHVIDLKTGTGSRSWNGDPGSNEYMKKKLDKYKQQLVFYKLLVENSREFKDYRVESGALVFVEKEDETEEIITLNHVITDQEAQDLADLIEIVYEKITKFDFPETDNKYPDTAKGVRLFIADLLDNNI